MFTSVQNSIRNRPKSCKPGQSMLEFLAAVGILLAAVSILVDFGRALNYEQVMIGLSRQGSNLASRGDTLAQAAQAVINGFAPLNSNNGEVIVTSVQTQRNVSKITGQASLGGIVAASKIGNGVGSTATVPAGSANMLQNGQTIYITEIFYNYQSITPLGRLLNIVIPSPLYQVAYF